MRALIYAARFVILKRLKIWAEFLAKGTIIALSLDMLSLDVLEHVGLVSSRVRADETGPSTALSLLYIRPNSSTSSAIIWWKNQLKAELHF